MKLRKGDRVELRKELNHLPQGLKGKVLQISGSDALISFDGEEAIYELDQFEINEYLRVIS